MHKAIRRLRSLSKHVRQHLAEVGPRRTLLWAKHELLTRWRERAYGIDTRTPTVLRVLSENPDAVSYEPISYEALDAAFEHLGVRAGEDVFLDYGCGLGRALVVAATHPFRRVIGVELDEALARTARLNIQRAKRKLVCPRVEVVTGDATSFIVPDDATRVLLFNPFTGATLASVLDQLRDSLARAPRPLDIIYLRPRRQPNALAPYDWLVRDAELPTGWSSWTSLSIYRARVGNKSGDINPISYESLGRQLG
jgi:SAM-dependent methyltransferase